MSNTKQIKDYDLQSGITGDEDILIQNGGVTRRIKASEFMNTMEVENYYTKEQVDGLLNDLNINIERADFYDKETIDSLLRGKADKYHTHLTSEINNLKIPTKLSELTNDRSFVDITYVTSEMNNLEIPTKVSDLTNDKNFVNDVYVANKIAEAQLTEKDVDLSGYYDKTMIDNMLQSKANYNHTHYVSEIANLQVPKKVSELTNDRNFVDEVYVANKIAEAQLSEGEVDLSGYYDKNTIDTKLQNKANYSHTHYVSDINNLQIPTKVSELQNDSDFANKSFVTTKIAEAQLGDESGGVDLSKYAQQSDLDLLESTVEDLKSSVSNGKTLVARAITDKGVYTSNTASFQTMADNIGLIQTNSGGEGGDDTPTTIPVTNVTLNYSYLEMEKGDSIRLIPIFTPSNATNQEVTWSLSNSGICTISNGMVVALESGNTTITATTVDGRHSATCSIKVKESTVSVTGVSLNKSSISLLQGATVQLSATVYPTNATNKTVTFSSVTPSIASVNSNGLVTAISSGTAVILVTTQDGGYQASCSIHVQVENEKEEEDIPSGSLTLEDSSVRNLVPYISTYYVQPTIKPNETLTLSYFVTDYYGRSYTLNSDFYRYTIIVKCDGKETQTINNVKAGEHQVTIGSFANEGTYHYSIMAVDQYGRCSHELFNYVRVKSNTNYRTYNVTASDISYYGITMNVSREVKQFVNCSSAQSNESIESLVQSAYDSTTVPSGKYVVFIPDRDNTQNYKGVNCDWTRCKVKYASDYNKDLVKQECANNRMKIQQLLEDKVTSGYNKIVMYKATYVIDENAIEIPSGLDLDLNGATIKMNPFTGQGALMVRFTDAIDTHLHNGTIEGDYFAHDYANSEYNSEWVSGFEMGGSCRYCSVYDLTVKDITGYGMQNGISNTSPNGNSFFNPILVGNMETGDIDKTTGNDINCSYRLRSGMVDISSYQGKSDFLTVSIHLNYQGNEFDTWNMVVYFYTSNQQFIKAINAYQYRQIKIPDGAYYARTVMYGQRIKSNWNIYYHFLRVPTHCEYRNVTVDNARCVGMAQGQMKDFLVKDCVISNSGQSSATCAYDAEDGWDGMQDVFFDNFSFPSNPNNCFLTCAGHNFVLENSDLARGHYLWERSRWVVIRNCTLEQGTIRGGGESNIVQHGIARYYNNTLTGLTYSLNFVSNILKDCTLSNRPQSGILINCTVGNSTVSKQICNNDINNPCVDDYGSLSNVDTGQTDYIGGGESGGSGSGGSGNDGTRVTSVKVSNSPITVTQGGTARINYVVYPSTATNQSVVFTSNSSYITVYSDGVVNVSNNATAGNYTVTLTTDDGGHTAECIIIVSASSSSDTIAVTGVSLNEHEATMNVNDVRTFGYSILPSNATDKSVYWYSANGNCSVNYDTGEVTARYVGIDYINVVTYDGYYSDSCKITIVDQNSGSSVAVQGVTLSTTNVSINVGEQYTLNATVQPSNATNKNLTWTTSNSSVATVTSGKVNGVSEGTAYITVTTQDGSYSATCLISVNKVSSGGGTGGGTGFTINNTTVELDSYIVFNHNSINVTPYEDKAVLCNASTNEVIATGLFEDTTRTIIYLYNVSVGTYNVYLSKAIVSDDNRTYTPIAPTSNTFTLTLTGSGDSGGGNVGGDDSGNTGGGTTPPVEEGVIFNNDNPYIGVEESVTLTLKDTSREISYAYMATGSATIVTYDKTTVTLKGVTVGKDYLNYGLSDGTSGSIMVQVQVSGGGSGDSGNTPSTVYGGIVLNTSSSSISDNSQGTFSVKLDSAPTQNQTIYISSNSSYVTVSPQYLTFNSSNYNSYQTVTYNASCNGVSSYTATITISSDNVSSKTFNLTVTHVNSGGSSSGGNTGGDSGGTTSGNYEEKDSSGLVIIHYPVTKKANPSYWCALGDSITAGTGAGGESYSYANVAGNMVGAVVQNYGIAGSCVNEGYNLALTEPGYEDAFCNRYVEMSNSADLVTVFGSVNDHRADSKIGDINSTDTKTFYGALNVLITGLKAKYPSSRIVFITPFKTADWSGKNMYGFTMTDFRNAIVGACNKHQLEVLDLFSVRALSWLTGLTSTPSLFYQYDYYHPTPDGHIAIANYLVEQMFGGSGSGGNTGGNTGGSTNIPVTGLNVNEWDVKMEVGENKTIGYTVTPSNATNKDVEWSSSNYYVASVSGSYSRVTTNGTSITISALSEGYTAITGTTVDGGYTYTIHVNVSASSSNNNQGGSSSSSSISNANETAITQQYSSSHEATPNAKISNLAGTAYYWKDRPRINPDGSFPQSTWNAFGHWMTTYIVEGSSYYDNVGLLLQNPKAWIWNTATSSWDVLSNDFEWGSWYLEDFWDDGSSYISGTTQWETGASGNHSTWVKIKQTSETSGRCFHPWGYQKDWRSNSNWANNGQPYIVTKVDFKLVKWDESGADNLAYANLVVNSGGDWWSAVGATWQPDWSTNRDMCVGKYVKATRDLKRAWATNLPSNWAYGLPTGD